MSNLGIKFQEIVLKQATKPAIKFCDNTQISFLQLEELSNKIANFLLRKSVKKEQVIAIQNDKTPFGYACIIACLKLGIIYTNFDSSNPKERLSKIFNTAQPSLVISDTSLAQSVVELCKKQNIEFLDYSQNDFINSQSNSLDENIIKLIPQDTPAYIMFTSGSTGIPKGVLIKQSSLLNFIRWGKKTYNITPDDILTNVNPIYFDNSVFDFYCSIFNGAALGAFPKNIVEQPKKMLECIDKMGCTFWFSVPSFLIYLTNIRLLNKDTFKKIRTFSFGGEGYPKDSLKKLYDLYSDRAKFFNVYGPTEGTCICSAYDIQDTDFDDMYGLVTLGHISSDFKYSILDSDNKTSKQGELCLMGPQLAIGYYNDKERTAKAFSKAPDSDQIMYRTGDIVEQKENGYLYFVGRADNQIKHMGYRIELEEIEANLIKLPYIKECTVVHGKTSNGFSRLVAYIATDKEVEQKELREDIRNFIPDYMVPNIFEILDQLPKNPNGKIDRTLLKSKAGLK